MSGLDQIAVERARQKHMEGWDYIHDEQHTKGEIALAAACYAAHAACVEALDRLEELSEDERIRVRMAQNFVHQMWPWAEHWFKPTHGATRNLVKAGALIAAEIDRVNGYR